MKLISTVQQGIVSDPQRAKFNELLPILVERHLDIPPPAEGVEWYEIPATFGYTAGKPSRSSIVQIDAPPATYQTVREALMQDVCDLWVDVVGCTINEIVVIVADHEQPSDAAT